MKRSRLNPGAVSVARGSTFASHGKGLKRSALKRGKPRSKPRVPPDVRADVLRRDGGLCVWSVYLGRPVRAQAIHHLLPKGVDGWPQYVQTRENLVSMDALAHLQHEFSPRDRLPWLALPAECRGFLLAVAESDARAARFVWANYPGAVQ